MIRSSSEKMIGGDSASEVGGKESFIPIGLCYGQLGNPKQEPSGSLFWSRSVHSNFLKLS